MPALGTLLYRLQAIADERWHALLSWQAAQGIAHKTPNAPLPTPVVWVDGTGVEVHTPFDALFRRVRSRRKAVVLAYCHGGASVGWRGVVGSGVCGQGAVVGGVVGVGWQWGGGFGSVVGEG